MDACAFSLPGCPRDEPQRPRLLLYAPYLSARLQHSQRDLGNGVGPVPLQPSGPLARFCVFIQTCTHPVICHFSLCHRFPSGELCGVGMFPQPETQQAAAEFIRTLTRLGVYRLCGWSAASARVFLRAPCVHPSQQVALRSHGEGGATCSLPCLCPQPRAHPASWRVMEGPWAADTPTHYTSSRKDRAGVSPEPYRCRSWASSLMSSSPAWVRIHLDQYCQ